MDDIKVELLKLSRDLMLITAIDKMRTYLKGEEIPSVVALPKNSQEIATILKVAGNLHMKVAVGGSTVDTKGLHGGVALILESMNNILEIDHENLIVSVEAGVKHIEFIRSVTNEGLYFPFEPYNISTSTLGSYFARGAIDSKSFVYGQPWVYLIGCEFVLPSGDIINISRKVIKDVAGYDLIHFMVGSFGTLGVLTKLLVKVLPYPKRRKMAVGFFDNVLDVKRSVYDIFLQRVVPARLNILNLSTINLFDNNKKYALFVELEGFEDSTDVLCKKVVEIFKDMQLENTIIIEESNQYNELWNNLLILKEKTHNDTTLSTINVGIGRDDLLNKIDIIENFLDSLEGFRLNIVDFLNGNIQVLAPNKIDKDYDNLINKLNDFLLSINGLIIGNEGYMLRYKRMNKMDELEEKMKLAKDMRNKFDPKQILSPSIII